jgi:hypothetical protein
VAIVNVKHDGKPLDLGVADFQKWWQKKEIGFD